MKYCVGVYLQCVVEADSADEAMEAMDEAMDEVTTFVDDVDYVEVCLVEEGVNNSQPFDI